MEIDKNKHRVFKKNDDGNIQHQAVHTDFHNRQYESTQTAELLTGLVKPFAVNVALEDHRSVYIKSPKKFVVKFSKNEVLLVGGDTPHGGMAYIYDPHHLPIQYHPSLHFVFASRRFKKDENTVSLNYGKDVYLTGHYAKLLNDNELVKKWVDSLEDLDELGKVLFTRRQTFGKKAIDETASYLTKWKKMQAASRVNKAASSTSKATSGNSKKPPKAASGKKRKTI